MTEPTVTDIDFYADRPADHDPDALVQRARDIVKRKTKLDQWGLKPWRVAIENDGRGRVLMLMPDADKSAACHNAAHAVMSALNEEGVYVTDIEVNSTARVIELLSQGNYVQISDW